jgi:hypothetical protein
MSNTPKPGSTDLSKVIDPATYRDLDERFRGIFREHKRQETESNHRRTQSYGWDRDMERRIMDEGYGAGC